MLSTEIKTREAEGTMLAAEAAEGERGGGEGEGSFTDCRPLGT